MGIEAEGNEAEGREREGEGRAFAFPSWQDPPTEHVLGFTGCDVRV